MNLRDLSSEISRLGIALHGLTDTNVESISQDSGMVLCDFDTSKLEDEIAELKESEESSAAEVLELTKDNAELTKRAEAAEELLDTVQCETELDGTKGATLRSVVKDRDEWKRIAEENRAICEAARAELTALRKRKGITVNLVACGREVEDFMNLCAAGQLQPEAILKHSAAIRAKLYAK